MSGAKPTVLWSAPLFDSSGYAEDARNLILGADLSGVSVRANELRWSPRIVELRAEDDRRIRELLSTPLYDPVVNLLHIFPTHFRRAQGAVRNIGRTMFETDRIPELWVAKCNEMDEIWVPCSFNVETFARSGVDLEKLRVLPHAMDVDLFRKSADPLLPTDGLGYVFLSSFDWQYRKGWDLLLTAYCREFKPEEEVTLVLKVHSSFGKKQEELEAEARKFVETHLGLDPDHSPKILFLDEHVSSAMMPSLYRIADCFVLPTRGEGWCRPFMEAMACGVPVIGTRFGGHLDFMHDGNSLLIDCAVVPVSEEAVKEVPIFRKHRWAEPIVEHLRELMRMAFVDRVKTKELGQKAKAEILSTYTREKIGAWAASLLLGEERESEKPVVAPAAVVAQTPSASPAQSPSARIAWEGSWFVNHSLAKVNRELVSRLLENPGLEFSLLPYEKDDFDPKEDPARYGKLASRVQQTLSGPPDITVSHRWPPRFDPPHAGHWVWIQPWEFGSLRVEWAKTVREKVDEVWVPSHYSRRIYLEAGLPPDRVHVVPNGVDTKAFHPGAKPFALPTTKKFKFLFVGGTIWRKGIDVLLTAYSAAFTDRDDVSLVVKDMGADTFYRGANARDMIHRIQDTPGSPEIVYLDKRLTEEEMAGLYAACQCLVHPYRGEGFGMPVAEAMACGLPVIVTKGGACDDFCDDASAYFIPARKRPLSATELETVGSPWVLEPDSTALALRLREVMADVEGRAQRGRKGHERILSAFTWDHAAAHAQQRINALMAKPIFRERGWLGGVKSTAAFFHFEDAGISGDGAAFHKLETQNGLSPGAAIALALTDCKAEWIGIASQGFRPGSGWLDQLRGEAADGGVILYRQPSGTLLFFPALLAQGVSPDASFRTGAGLLEFARKLKHRGAAIMEVKDLPVRFENSDAAFALEAAAVDALEEVGRHLQDGKIEDAMDAITRSLAAKADYEAALSAAGEVLLLLGQFDHARQSASRLLTVAPQSPQAYELLGRCHFQSGKNDEAEQAFRESLRLDKGFAGAWSGLAVTLWSKGDAQGAVQALRAALQANPNDPDALFNSAEVLKALGRGEEALPFLEKYLLQFPEDRAIREKLEEWKAACRRSEGSS